MGMKKFTMKFTIILVFSIALSLCGCGNTGDSDIQTAGVTALTYFTDVFQSEYGKQVLDALNTLSFNQNDKENGEYIYSEESEISKIGLNLSLENISSTGATLIFNQYDADAPTGELIYGTDFVIELQENGKWEEAPITLEGEYGFTAVAFTIASGDKTEREMKWEWLYGELAPGEYRIGKSILDFRKTGDYDEYMIYANFVLN